MEALKDLLGYKLFKKEDENDFIRIIGIDLTYDDKISKIKVRNEYTNEEKEITDINELKGYSLLEPDACIKFSIVHLKDTRGKIVNDVIVTASRTIDLKLKDTIPFAVCRQSITDIFYNLIRKNENDELVGLALNKNDCPSNFDFKTILLCDGIDYMQSVYYYKNDTLKGILKFIKQSKFDKVLSNLYDIHIKYSRRVSAQFKLHDKGWCKNLSVLLENNNFQYDVDEMLGITPVDFDMSNYVVNKKVPGDNNIIAQELTPDVKRFFEYIHKIKINDNYILKFKHDIDLADYKYNNYLFIRDNTDETYFLVYTLDNTRFESDLQNEYNMKDISDKFRLQFFNKY